MVVASVLTAVDWSDPVASAAALYPLIGKLLAAVINTPELTRAEVTRLEWVWKLGKQLRDFRDVAEIEAMRRRLTGGDEPHIDVTGPQLEPSIPLVVDESAGRERPRVLRGRPRKRAFA